VDVVIGQGRGSRQRVHSGNFYQLEKGRCQTTMGRKVSYEILQEVDDVNVMQWIEKMHTTKGHPLPVRNLLSLDFNQLVIDVRQSGFPGS
jgi:hypothetical protein